MIATATDFDLLHHNTFRLPCRAERWVEFSGRNDIPAVAEMLEQAERSLVIGGGSNILFTSPRFDGTVAHSAILTLETETLGGGRVRLTAGSGLTMDSIIERVCRAGLWGMENLSLIPGEAGASAVQNVGAYGCEAADIIDSVEAYDTVSRRFVTLTPPECDFSYRHSLFKTPQGRGRFIIASVTFVLSSEPKPRLDYGNLSARFADGRKVTPMAVREEIIAVRRSKLPDTEETGSAGSYFTNPQLAPEEYEQLKKRVDALYGKDGAVPHFTLADGRVKVPAAWLIDRAGLKGSAVGGAALWPGQPLVIANMSGHCTSADVMALERKVVDTVAATFGVNLVPEVEKA